MAPTLLGVFAILIAGAAVALIVIGLLSCLRLEGWLANTLATFVLAFAVVVLSAEVLSELHALHRMGFLMAHLTGAALTAPLWLAGVRTCVPRQVRDIRQALRAGISTVQGDPLLAIVCLSVLLTFILGAVLISIVPPNTWDSFMYHLSRAAMWLQNGTLRHFATPLQLRNAYPINAELAQLWLMALWGSDRLVAYVQWAAALMTMLSIYGTARLLSFSRSGSLFAAFLWSTFTIVVVQTTSTKNDLLLATLCSVGFYFLLRGLQLPQPRLPRELLVFGLTMGLAVGTKYLAALLLPGIGLLALLLLARSSRHCAPRLAYAALWSVLGLAGLGAYNYVLNWVHYGALTGPPHISLGHAIQNPTWDLFVANLARMMFNACDLGGLPYRLINALQPLRVRMGEWLFAVLRIDPNPPETFELNWPFTFTLNIQMIPREDASWYGPLGWLLLAPIVAYYLTVAPWKRAHLWRSVTAFTVLCYVLAFAATIYWLPWEGRMLLIPVSIGASLLAGFYDGTARCRALRWMAALIGLVVLWWSATQNYHKPLWGPDAIWRMDLYAKRAIQAPEMAALYRDLDAAIPQHSRLGVLGPWPTMRWDYLFHGPTLQRTVVWIGEELYPVTADLLQAYDLDYLLFTAQPADVVVSTLELHDLGTAWDLRWFWVAAPPDL